MKNRYFTNVATLKLDTDKCTGCGMCAVVCPHGVFDIDDGKAVIKDLDGCMECGACALNCAFSAISVSSGVGCAAAIINGILTGSEPSCDCSGGDCSGGSGSDGDCSGGSGSGGGCCGGESCC